MTTQSADRVPDSAERTRRAKRIAAIILAGISIVYSVLVIKSWNLGHLDFGDGNYMYIGWRISEGAVLYRDILAPQPPVHLYIGAALAWIGGALPKSICPHPLYAFRAFSLVLHLGTMLLVFAATLAVLRPRVGNSVRTAQSARDWYAATWAAAVYMVVPIGFWWSLGYQSEPTEMAFLVASFAVMIRWTSRSMIVAGILAAFGPLCNMTAAVYVLFTGLWLLVRKPRLFLQFALPVVLITGAVVAIMEAYTGAYLENVVFNQVGSFPRRGILGPGHVAYGINVNDFAQNGPWSARFADILTVVHYALGKWHDQGSKILNLEGGFILLGLLGLMHYARRNRTIETEYVLWYTILMFGSVAFTAKGGTMDYIFSIGEPFMAIFAGISLSLVLQSRVQRAYPPARLFPNLSPAAACYVKALVLFVICYNGMRFNYLTLRQFTYELSERETLKITSALRRLAPANGLILSPPHYAFVAQRRLASDYSELFLWTLKYANERLDQVNGRGVRTVEEIAKLLDQRRIEAIALDVKQTGKIPEITASIDRNYKLIPDPVELKDELHTLNVVLRFYIPKSE